MQDELRITIGEPRSGLLVTARLLQDRAPENCAFLWRYLADPRTIPALHAIYTGPEISFAIPAEHIAWDTAPPLENATCFPAPGDILLTHVPPRVFGGGPNAVYDLGLFYAAGGRTLLPMGYTPGSVVASVDSDLQDMQAACARIRRFGAVSLELRRA